MHKAFQKLEACQWSSDQIRDGVFKLVVGVSRGAHKQLNARMASERSTPPFSLQRSCQAVDCTLGQPNSFWHSTLVLPTVVPLTASSYHAEFQKCLQLRGKSFPHFHRSIVTAIRFPAQGVARAEARVPSLLYYDQSGAVRAAGAEALTQDIIQTAKSEGWMKAELLVGNQSWYSYSSVKYRWKLHLYPSPSVKDIPPLPSGKSIFDVLTDFIKYLFECCKSYIQECHPRLTWAIVEDSIEYILTYPSGWGEQQYLYRQAIQRAGLVSRTPSMGQHRVFTLTEGEACLQSCIAHLVKGMVGNQATPPGVVIIDAGGGIIDLSMFSITVTSKQTSYEEIAPPECMQLLSIAHPPLIPSYLI